MNFHGGLRLLPLHTGDFDTKEDRAKLVFRLYERLSHANALVPPALAFVFDREGRSEQELVDLEKRDRAESSCCLE